MVGLSYLHGWPAPRSLCPAFTLPVDPGVGPSDSSVPVVQSAALGLGPLWDPDQGCKPHRPLLTCY